MARTAARDLALQVLFAKSLGGGGEPNDILSMSDGDSAGEVNPLEQDDYMYIDDVLLGAARARDDIDEAIERNLKGWDIERLSRVDLCILRLAIYEMLNREDIPVSVSANEAVELAHRYSTDEAPMFINGVIGAVARELDRS